MSAQSSTYAQTAASLNKYWKKIQFPMVQKCFAHGKREEKQLFNSFEDAGIPWSGYENTIALDLNERGGIASLEDFGAMAKPSSVNAVEGTVTAVHFNGRFNISDVAKYADRGQENQLQRQLKAQATQKSDAMVEHFSDYFHGSASALLATTDSDISGTTPTLTLAAGYGQAGITNAKYLASMFKVGDRVALADSSNVLVDTTDSFGSVTAVSKANGTITLLLDGSVTYSTNGIKIYKANNIEGTTIAGGSDYLKGIVGDIDIFEATSLHNVSGSTYPNWTAAYSDTVAGRFTHSKLRKGKDEIKNDGGVEADVLMVSQGVYRDMIAQERAGLRYDDTGGLSFDGDVKAKGLTIFKSKNVPPGYVRLFARSVMKKWEILPTEEKASWGELQSYEDYAGMFGRIDWFGNRICTNRKGLAYWTSQTES